MMLERSGWESQWQDLRKYIAPTRGSFNDTPNSGKAIDYKTALDSTPARANGTLAAGMTSGMTSPSRPWFKPTFADKDILEYEPVKYWLESLESLMYAIYARSGIYSVLTNVYEELGAFGTGCAIVLEDYDTVIRGENYTIGEYAFACDNKGRVNSMARELYMTNGQMVREFGKENISSDLRARFEQGEADIWVRVRMLIEPNDERIPDYPGPKGMAYRSVYWEAGGSPDKFLRVSGYHEFPVLGPRWRKATTASIYGHGPGWDAIGDVRELMKVTKDGAIALAKVIDPPLQTPTDATIRTIPGAITRTNSQLPNAGVLPLYQINPDLPAVQARIEQKKRDIRAAFFADMFLMFTEMNGPEKTAREIVERHSEKLLILGPVLESLIWELLNPLHERTFAMIMRAGILPPPPQEIMGMPLEMEYISNLAQAQKMAGTVPIEQSFAFLGNVAAAYPDVKDVVDPDEAIRQYFTLNGVSPRIVRGADVVNEIRGERAKAMQQAEAAQNAAALVQGAKTLSDTKIGQNSALDSVIAGVTGIPTGQTNTGIA